MTKNEFKTALKRAEDLIDDVNDIFDKIIYEMSLLRNDVEDLDDIEDLRDALFDMYPTGWSTPASEIFDEYCKFFNDDDKKANAELDLWTQYITYLHKWANDHKDQAFYGCTPACFEEWYDNEYAENNE